MGGHPRAKKESELYSVHLITIILEVVLRTESAQISMTMMQVELLRIPCLADQTDVALWLWKGQVPGLRGAVMVVGRLSKYLC